MLSLCSQPISETASLLENSLVSSSVLSRLPLVPVHALSQPTSSSTQIKPSALSVTVLVNHPGSLQPSPLPSTHGSTGPFATDSDLWDRQASAGSHTWSLTNPNQSTLESIQNSTHSNFLNLTIISQNQASEVPYLHGTLTKDFFSMQYMKMDNVLAGII